jgi:hypothetical protein
MANKPVSVCIQGITDVVRVSDWVLTDLEIEGDHLQQKGEDGEVEGYENNKSNRWKMVREQNMSLLPGLDGDGSHASGISANVNQIVQVCAEHKKPRKLIRFIEKVREEDKASGRRNTSAILIFCTKIKTVTFVDKFLQERNGLKTAVLHSHIVRCYLFLCLNPVR